MSGPAESHGEDALLAAALRGLGPSVVGPAVIVGPGDDAAVLRLPGRGQLLLTADMLVEGQHFERHGPLASDYPDIGWRAAAVNLSDIAAMGGRPLWALASIALPPDVSPGDLQALHAGLGAAAQAHSIQVVGGNLARSEGRLVVDVTLAGIAERPILRGGARVGDRVCVTGRVGAAAAGLALLGAPPPARQAVGVEDARYVVAAQRRPVPRVREGQVLAALPDGAVHAMCDVSDGVARDLYRLCGQGMGAVLWPNALPIPPQVRLVAAGLGHDALDWALRGGEDYELLCAVDPTAVDATRAAVASATGTELHAVGEIVTADDRQLWLGTPDGGRTRTIRPDGWDPFA